MAQDLKNALNLGAAFIFCDVLFPYSFLLSIYTGSPYAGGVCNE